jgi:ferredoxin-NADP reductase
MSSAASATEKQSISLLPATLESSEQLSPEARLMTLRIEDDRPFNFLAGQAVRVHQQFNGHLVPLFYSIASAPCGDNRLELCVKPGRTGSPADHLCATPVGSRLRISRPQGGFVLQQSGANTLFLAAGTGIAPIRSMIHWLVGRHAWGRIRLVFGARDAESLFFHAEFADLAARHTDFQYVPVLSRPHEAWKGASGHVQHHVGGVSREEGTRTYLCGPPAMVESVRQSLGKRGWPEELIHYDRHGV